mgnify:CR=1 FL=1
MENERESLLKKTQAGITDGLIANPITVAIESENQGGFHTKISMRQHSLSSDQPFGFNGQNNGPKPSELVLAAIAACQETTWRIFAEDMGVEINKIAVRLWGEQDLKGFMAMDEITPAGFTKIWGEVLIESSAPMETLLTLQSLVEKHCPALDDITRPVPVKLNVKKS